MTLTEKPPINSYELRQDGWCLFRIPKCLLVFTREEVVRAMRRGKIWRRHGGEKLAMNTSRRERK